MVKYITVKGDSYQDVSTFRKILATFFVWQVPCHFRFWANISKEQASRKLTGSSMYKNRARNWKGGILTKLATDC